MRKERIMAGETEREKERKSVVETERKMKTKKIETNKVPVL